MNTFGLPETVYERFRDTARQWTLNNYCTKEHSIPTDWDKRGEYGFIWVCSVQVAESSSKGLKLLRGLVKEGLLTEKEKHYPNELVRFFIASKDHEDELLRQAHDYWRSFGYEVGVISERKHP